MNNLEQFPTFNGLNRPAMLFGIPLMYLVLTMAIVTFFMFIGFNFNWGIYTLIPPFLGIVFLMFLKMVCQDDPNALVFIEWKIKAFFLTNNKSVIYLTSNQSKNRIIHNANRKLKL